MLQYNGDAANALLPCGGIKPPALWQDFAEDSLAQLPTGKLLRFGDTLWCAPEQMPGLDGLKVLRAGLELGQLRKGRFDPAHALALADCGARSVCRLDAADPALRRYLQGETIPGSQTGWTLVCADAFGIGWAKGSSGVLKNHFPKGLRWNSSMGSV